MAEKKTPSTGAVKPTLPNRVIANKVRVTDPGYRKQKDAVLSDLERSRVNASIKDLRQVDAVTAIRALTRFNGIFSTAVHSYIQLAMSGYTVMAYSAGTHQFDPASTNAAQSVLVSADTLYDYTAGYADKQSIDGLLESMLKEVIQTGAAGMELVLNPYRLPEQLIPVPVTSLKWKSTQKGSVYPYQISQTGEEVDLNIPTFFYAATHQQSNSIHPRSPMEAALQTLYVFSEFMEDLTRVLRKSGHSRLVVKILQQAIQDIAAPDVQSDPIKLRQHFESIRSDIEQVVSNLDPEDALVLYDSAEVDVLKTAGEKADYSSLLSTLGALMASSLKSMASVLGLSQGSQNLATTEALVYLKLVQSIQVPIETIMSRAITLAVRLLTGTDSYCKFRFKQINLRPAEELSAHQAVLFSIAKQKLSLGLYTDDEFAYLVGAGPRPANAPNLSGTLFMDQSQSSVPADVANNNGAGSTRNLNEGTAQGPSTSQPGGAPLK